MPLSSSKDSSLPPPCIDKIRKRLSFVFLCCRVIVFLSFSESSLHFFDQAFYSSLALIHRHAGVLGLASCVQAFPYDVPSWMPQILLDLGDHLHDPHPIQVREMEEGLLCIGFCRPCDWVTVKSGFLLSFVRHKHVLFI